MSRLLILTRPALAPGFQLAGVQAFGAADVESAEELICQWLAEGETGLLAIDESLLAGLSAELLSRLQAAEQLPYLAIPGGRGSGGAATRRAQISNLLRRAIGIHITFTGVGQEEQGP